MAMIGGRGGGAGEGLIARRRRFRSVTGHVRLVSWRFGGASGLFLRNNWENIMEKWKVGGALANCENYFLLLGLGPCGPFGYFPFTCNNLSTLYHEMKEFKVYLRKLTLQKISISIWMIMHDHTFFRIFKPLMFQNCDEGFHHNFESNSMPKGGIRRSVQSTEAAARLTCSFRETPTNAQKIH